MATQKAPPTKAEFVEALRKNGINDLEDLVAAILPETGGYRSDDSGLSDTFELTGGWFNFKVDIDMKKFWDGPDAP